MKISIVGPAHPYRGGLAVIMQSMARVFQHRGDEVKIKTFTLQYPRIFFPGRNQTVQTPPPPDLYIVRCVNTMNPFNWIAVGRWIAREKPDFVLMKYWTPLWRPVSVRLPVLPKRTVRRVSFVRSTTSNRMNAI